MIAFYAFCRVVDDIADDADIPDAKRFQELDSWETGLKEGFKNPDPVQAEMVRICHKYSIDSDLLIEIVHGMKMDIGKVSYPTFEALKGYCYRVACAVGIVSLDIFGASHPASRDYAINLGYALQLTNILRDVAEDASVGRLYLPEEDMDRFGVNAKDLLAGKLGSGFVDLMNFESERAQNFFDAADEVLPREDMKALCAARRMSKIYRNILERMIRDNFKVFEKRYRPGRLKTLAVLLFG